MSSVFSGWTGLTNVVADLWRDGWMAESMLGLAIPTLIPALFLFRWRNRSYQYLWVAFIGIFISWASYSTMPRYLLPAVPLFCILGSVAICRGDLPAAARVAALAPCVYILLAQISTGMIPTWYRQGAWAVSLGHLTRDEYLLHERPGYNPYFAAARFINEHTPPDSKVLIVGDERAFYLKRKFRVSSLLLVNPLADWSENSSNPAGLAGRFRANGLTHLMVNKGRPCFQEMLQNLTLHGRSVMDNFSNRYLRLGQDKPNDSYWVQVYQVVSASDIK